MSGRVLAIKEFQSTHPVRGATHPAHQQPPVHAISIHAPREGCDRIPKGDKGERGEFQSTHPVRGATDAVGNVIDGAKFQSTHPVRGATDQFDGHGQIAVISIHAPRVGCDGAAQIDIAQVGISIHAPREGCDV